MNHHRNVRIRCFEWKNMCLLAYSLHKIENELYIIYYYSVSNTIDAVSAVYP